MLKSPALKQTISTLVTGPLMLVSLLTGLIFVSVPQASATAMPEAPAQTSTNGAQNNVQIARETTPDVPRNGPMTKVRIGTLKFGTVNWEIDVIKHHHLDKKAGIELEVIPLASKNAAAVALQGGAVDIIVTDWIWVSRQRAENRKYTFAPYSVIAGGLMVRPDSGIQSIADLSGKRIGVAGGPVDKSWLMMRAFSLKTQNLDLTKVAEPVYGAPPLLNRLLENGEFPAVLTFWHYQARLKAKGMKKVIDIKEVLKGLGVTKEVPIVGWVFNEAWAQKNTAALTAFLKASANAKELLARSDEEWQRLEPLIKPGNQATLIALRDGYRDGIPGTFGPAEVKAAADLYAILAHVGGKKLVGKATHLTPGTFWPGAISGANQPAVVK